MNYTVQLPVTDFFYKNFSKVFENTWILHVNHLLDDVYALSDILESKSKHLTFIGVPYRDVLEDLEKFPYPFLTAERNPDIYYPKLNRHAFLEGSDIKSNQDLVLMVVDLMKYALENIIKPKIGPNDKLLLIEDGGYSYLIRPLLESFPQFIGSVEQTEGGARNLAKIADTLNSPVISISRALIKKNFESYFIGSRVLGEANLLFYSIGEFLEFRKIIVGGYGVIGRQLAQYLRSAYSYPVVIDPDNSAELLAQMEGFQTSQELSVNLIDSSFAYFGCAGSKSFGFNGLKSFLDSSRDVFYLVSGSSKRVEFFDLIQFFEQQNKDYVELFPYLKYLENIDVLKHPIGLEYTMTYKGVVKRLILVAGGVPVNFYRPGGQSVPDRAIDPINCLLVLAATLLLEGKTKLDKKIYYLGQGTGVPDHVSEEEVMRVWCDVNDIHLPHKDMLNSYFKPHPLR